MYRLHALLATTKKTVKTMASFASTEAFWTNKIIHGSSNNTQGTRVGLGFLDGMLEVKGRKEFPAKW